MLKKLHVFFYAFGFTLLFIAAAMASQSDPNEGANLSGLTFRQNLNNATAAMLTSHSGTSRPSYAVAGTVWLDTSATPWKMKLFDGTSDITIGEFNSSSHTFQGYNGTALNRLQLYAADTGAANAYAIAPTPALAAYATGQIVTLKPANANTAASTINVSSLGTKNIKLPDGSNPTANAMVTTGIYALMYDGTNFVLLNPSVGASITAIANGGTANSTAAGARGSTGLNIDEETTHGDSIYTILATDRVIATSASFTASRTWTLPAANAVNAGQRTCIIDQAGGVTNSNTLVIARAGSDTIDGGTSYTLNGAYQGVCLISDGTSKWSSGKSLKIREYCVAMSDQSTALTTGTSEATLYLPAAVTVNSVRAYVNTAPTGSFITVDINEAGTTLMNTNKVTIDAGTKTSLSAGTQPALTDTSIAANAEITFDIDHVGSTVAGAGLVACIDVTF